MKQKPTAKDLQLQFHLSTFGRYEILLPNIHFLYNEMDLFGFRKNSGFSDEIEIKLSKSDFLADFKKVTYVDGEEVKGENYSYFQPTQKPKHESIEEGIHPCNYFSFLMPEELSEQCEIPPYAGLYIYGTNRHGQSWIREARKAPRMHSRKLSDEKKYDIAKKAVFKCWNMMSVK